MNNFGQPPLPPNDGGLIRKIVKAFKMFTRLFKKPSEETGNMDSINDTSSLDNIDRITQIFSDFKEQIHSKTIEVENTVGKEVDFYVEELHNILQDNSEKVDKYNIRIKRIERQIDKISSKVKGTIDNEISKKISLNNTECKNVIKMIPGAKKEDAMNEFLHETVKYALEECCKELRSSLEEIYEDVKQEVIGAVESIQKQIELLQNGIGSIDEDNHEETSKQQMIDAYYLLDTFKLVEEIME